MTWYVDSILGTTSLARAETLSKLPPDLIDLLVEKGRNSAKVDKSGKLPAELMDMVREFFNANKDAIPMSVDEAKDHRLSLMEERSAFKKTAEDGWQEHSYSFCEH